MSFFITDKEAEELLAVEGRELAMPDGTMRLFTGFKLMWKALDFLIVCGRWSKRELIDLALRMQESDVLATGALPEAHGKPGPVSMLEIKMLESPRVDPALITPIANRDTGTPSLDDCLHNVVSALYRDLQERLG